MKELTIEQKAKRFDEAIAMAKECITYVPDKAVNEYMLNMFPELAESEYEKISKALIKLVKKAGEGYENVSEGVSIQKAISWLEEHKYTEDDIRKAMGEGLEKMNPLVKNVTKELMDAYELGFLTCFQLLTGEEV